MVDEARKAARRAQVENELKKLRHSRDGNTTARNRLTCQIEESQSARNQLEGHINNMIQIEGEMEYCHNITSIDEFKGGRRQRLESQLKTTSSCISREIASHKSNLSRITRSIVDFSTRRDNLSATIRSQSNRINELERELRELW